MAISNITYNDLHIPGQVLIECTVGSSGDTLTFNRGKIKAVSVAPTSASGTGNLYASFSGQTITVSGDQISDDTVNLHVYYYL